VVDIVLGDESQLGINYNRNHREDTLESNLLGYLKRRLISFESKVYKARSWDKNKRVDSQETPKSSV
jgi:hypothetical protein